MFILRVKYDMKRLLISLFVCLFAASFAANAQMSDEQVVEYVKSAAAAGKSETQIGKELLAKGVTPAQAERIKAKYEKEADKGESLTQKALNRGEIRRVTREETLSNQSGLTEEMFEQLEMGEEEQLDSLEMDKPKIFGHDIFNNKNLSFEPNLNAATPEDYKLGPGDQVLIDIWGYNEANIDQTISPEGKIYIEQIGPIQLNGLTIKSASDKIRRALVSKYAGVGGSDPNSYVSVALGNIRTIQVNVMGEVNTPGSFRLSSFSTVFTALHSAGGVTEIGSLRAIKVVRGGKEIATVDIYEYLFNGKSDSDLALKEGDVVIVPPYVNLVEATGSVKRPMFYEMLDGEPVEKLVAYAGGFASNAYRKDVTVIRQTGEEREIFTVGENRFSSWALEDGDEIRVGETLKRFANKIEVKGMVFHPGEYELGGEIATLKQLVNRAGGPTEDAFLARAVILREKDNLDLETISVNLGAVLEGMADDVLLRKNDILVVSGIHELRDRGTLTINGMVVNPGTFPFAENTTVEDLILQAGGLLDGASTARVDVARRVVDPASTTVSDTLGVSFSFPLKDGLAIDGGENFVLEPFDVVSVRASPGFKKQRFVELSGEVAFPGPYVLINEGERLSSVIERAGGTNPRAYLRGATLKRKAVTSEDEKESKDIAAELLAKSVEKLERKGEEADTLDVEDLEINQDYFVAIDLEQAVANPGSDFDVVLREGDSIVVPEYDGTVKIQGEVMFPNAVAYNQSKSLRYYIDAAGGYSVNAKRSKVYVIYMNGKADRARLGNVKIEPGCTIVIPSKGERKQMSAGEVMSLASTATSMTSAIAMLLSLIR